MVLYGFEADDVELNLDVGEGCEVVEVVHLDATLVKLCSIEQVAPLL